MFTFVDQITDFDERSIRGRFSVPDQFGGAPDWLIVEALGQLAGWAAMRAADFNLRPVGATVGLLEFKGRRRPRGVLGLSATIERTDRRAILYRGAVSCGGSEVASMRRCIGPLLPMEMLENADRARARFDSLIGPRPIDLWGADDRLPESNLTIRDSNGGDPVTAEFHVAEGAPLFRDHFPNQPVVPATMLIESMGRTACAAFARSAGVAVHSVTYQEVRQVKVRRFTKPGERLVLEARLPTADGGSAEVSMTARNNDETVATVRVVVRCAD